MNRENILKVADAIEAACAPGAKPKIGFSMVDVESDFAPHTDMTGHRCGTVCCIKGWVSYTLEDLSPFHEDATRPVVLLDISADVAEELFYPDGLPSGLSYGTVTPRHAVAVLRHLADTGEVDWTVGAPQTEEAA